MSERWRQPPEVLSHAQSDTETVAFGDGRVFVDEDETLPPEQIEQIRQGRRCFNCKEPFEEAWPSRCEAYKLPSGQPVGCFYPVAQMQLIDFAAKYSDHTTVIDKNRKVVDELARMEERDIWEEKQGIYLPREWSS
jgi:hypothetical protein